MRHSRKAVMKERYSLYLKKNVFNGRYLVRNMQIAVGVGVVTVMVAGATVLANTNSSNTTSMKEYVKEALFSSSEDEKTVTGNKVKEDALAEADKSITEQKDIASTQVVKSEDVTTQMVQPVEQVSTEQNEFEEKCIANVDGTLNIRKAPSEDAEFAGSMNRGAIAKVQGTEGEWTKIKSGDVEGYVLTEYILTGEEAEKFAQDYVTLHGTVLEDGVNIRTEKSTNADIVNVLDKDDTITVLEIPETKEEVKEKNSKKAAKETEEIEWLAVRLEDGEEGYVSADLVNVDRLYEIAVSAEDLERMAAEEEAARIAAEEEAARLAQEQAEAELAQQQATTEWVSEDYTYNDGYDYTTTQQDYVYDEPDTTVDNNTYEPSTVAPLVSDNSGEYIGSFTVTGYCGCTSCSGGNGLTATGTVPVQGRTIAADPSVLPYGTQVVIDGVVYTVEDCGSGVCGNHIDIFFADHQAAAAFGRRTTDVYRY